MRRYRHLPDDRALHADILGELWRAQASVPDWEVNDRLTAGDWAPARFRIQAGLHNPDIGTARLDDADDPNAARALQSRGVESATLELIDAYRGGTGH